MLKKQKRHRMKTLSYIAFWLFACISYATIAAEENPAFSAAVKRLDARFEQLVSAGSIAGAQFAVARDRDATIVKCYGTVAVGSQPQVDQNTLFLIGSCSKPFASACVLSLIDDPRIEIALSDRIDRWIPAYESANTTSGMSASRAPTVEELMAHRAGIYSQKVGMSRAQAIWIRRFSHSLTDAVDGISKYALIAQPGQQYAYSGAGYCVLGRVAEIAANEPFEEILRQRLCTPLGLTRTTYFPAQKFPDNTIATGYMPAAAPHRLGSEHRMPLIGGSLYSTAEEMSKFGQAIVLNWGSDREVASTAPLISAELLKEFAKIRSRKSSYSIGWKVQQKAGSTIRLSHSGALQSYRAYLVLDVNSQITVSACWTLASDKKTPMLTPQIVAVLNEALPHASTPE